MIYINPIRLSVILNFDMYFGAQAHDLDIYAKSQKGEEVFCIVLSISVHHIGYYIGNKLL